ncbi:hypothetical protein SLA_2541 [Streptomyces laurentii]|uniref:Uncharacterized protein n=1 Tax=Streptomyces laurentii TaxID=39478 RepID=A0A169NFA7_STRLU|nr:hypothetical protein SLA_2541 [Streptomyces laurentii]
MGVLAHTFSERGSGGGLTGVRQGSGGLGRGCEQGRPRDAGTPLGGYSAGMTWRAAIFFAVSESGPGCGTKTASR